MICRDCQVDKPTTEFYRMSHMKSGFSNQCKECSHAYQRARRATAWPKLFRYMGGECAHCGLNDPCPAVYDMHHIDPSTKEKQIATLIRGSWEKLIKEADKCVLLCSNCHRRHHFENA